MGKGRGVAEDVFQRVAIGLGIAFVWAGVRGA